MDSLNKPTGGECTVSAQVCHAQLCNMMWPDLFDDDSTWSGRHQIPTGSDDGSKSEGPMWGSDEDPERSMPESI